MSVRLHLLLFIPTAGITTQVRQGSIDLLGSLTALQPVDHFIIFRRDILPEVAAHLAHDLTESLRIVLETRQGGWVGKIGGERVGAAGLGPGNTHTVETAAGVRAPALGANDRAGSVFSIGHRNIKTFLAGQTNIVVNGHKLILTCFGYNSIMSDTEFNIYNPQPLLIVLSGPSGVGKDSVLHGLKERGLPIHFVVTTTTRPRRAEETHGVDYFFVTKDEFAHMIEQDELIEYAIVYSDYKGIPKQQVRDALASGKDVIMRLDVQGAETIRKLAPEAVLVFLTTQTEEELVERLKRRKSEPADDLSLRIATARQELKRAVEFDYVVVNADSHLKQTVDTVTAIIDAEHHRVNPRKVSL
jgi:guanylate kinase